MNGEDRYAKARALSAAARRGQFARLLEDRNVTGVGYGRRTAAGVRTDEPALVVFVARKVSTAVLPMSAVLPRRVYFGRDFLEVDVVETGPLYLQSFTARERPVPYGVSVGRAAEVSAGTWGSLVIDNTDGTLCVLSNNHVLAAFNAAPIGDMDVQQGVLDGGATPADDIATLKRFVPYTPVGNVVDCAISQILDAGAVVQQVKDNLIPVATREHPAIGLLFAGGCNRTLINPIDVVLQQLDISLPPGEDFTSRVEIGQAVEKVGRTTEYTTSSITEIDVSAVVGDGQGGSFQFDGQLATSWMSEAGDSGSLVYLGGEGGAEDRCGSCGTTSAASQLLERPLGLDEAIEKDFRNRYVMQTQLGRYLVDTYFANEDRLVARARSTDVREADRRFAQRLYDTFAETVRQIALAPERSDVTLTAAHVDEARKALNRAAPYLRTDELAAAQEALEIVSRFEGRRPVDGLQLLDDAELLRLARDLVDRVDFLVQPDPGGPAPRSPERNEPPPGSAGGTAKRKAGGKRGRRKGGAAEEPNSGAE